jgi:hypothetical protein
MRPRNLGQALAAVAILAASTACDAEDEAGSAFQEEFAIADCNMVTTGRSPYFVLEPGYQLVLEGGDTKLQITVLDQTKPVDGVDTRVVEEREWEDGELIEVSQNYFAMCEGTGDMYYFGEDVDFYEDGEIANHEGAWLAGVDNNRAGMIMPAAPKVDMRYYQEIAPGVAMDRAEVVSLDETCETPAGTFPNCLKVRESTALDVLETEYKYHAPDIGLVQDEDLLLVKHGFVDGK